MRYFPDICCTASTYCGLTLAQCQSRCTGNCKGIAFTPAEQRTWPTGPVQCRAVPISRCVVCGIMATLRNQLIIVCRTQDRLQLQRRSPGFYDTSIRDTPYSHNVQKLEQPDVICWPFNDHIRGTRMYLCQRSYIAVNNLTPPLRTRPDARYDSTHRRHMARLGERISTGTQTGSTTRYACYSAPSGTFLRVQKDQ